MSDFDIFLDSDNELAFSLDIEGAEAASVRSQFVIEGPRGIGLTFEGQAAGSDVVVEVPTLKGMVTEGTYQTRLEVIIDDRVFTPLELQARIKPSIKVEAAVRTAKKVHAPVVSARVISTPRRSVQPIVEADNRPKPTTDEAPIRPATAVKPRPRPRRSLDEKINLDALLDVLES